jgi:hypothetical protein
MNRVGGSADPRADGVGMPSGMIRPGISPEPVGKSVDKMLEKCVPNVEERGPEALPIFYANTITA